MPGGMGRRSAWREAKGAIMFHIVDRFCG